MVWPRPKYTSAGLGLQALVVAAMIVGDEASDLGFELSGRAAAARLTQLRTPCRDRRFIDEVVGRRNARNRKRIEIERAALKALPERRTTPEEARVTVTSRGGSIMCRMTSTAPSR